MTSKSTYFRFVLVGALGFFLFGSGVYLFLHWIEMFTKMRGKEMALSPTSKAFPDWKISPLPLNFDVYLFNWTNPEDFYTNSSKKPHFEELGPYRFRELPDKVDIVWHNYNHSISFRKKGTFFFDAANSRGSLQDRITSVNTVAHAAALRAINAKQLQKNFLSSMLRWYREGLSITKTAEEWMFTGYKDPLVTMGSLFSFLSKDIQVPFDRVGYLYTRNDSSTYDGHFNMYTGADDIRKMGQINTWNHMKHNGIFPDVCGEVKGSMGEFFPPNLKAEDVLQMYIPNLCRAIPLDYSEMVEIHGVTAYRYVGGYRAVDNGTLYPEAKCFCVNNKCEPSGIINISPCKYNTSIYMSFPHFYKADSSYLEAVSGLTPEKEKHEFFMTLEPNAGVPMEVGGGFQANYLLEPISGISPFDNIPRVFMPLMWAEERVTVSAEIAKDIGLVPLIVLLGQILTGALLAGGTILICWYPTKFVNQMCHDPKTKTNLLGSHNANTAATVAVHLKRATFEGFPLIEYNKYNKQNGDGNIPSSLNASSDITNSLLGNTIKMVSNDVITR